MPNQTTLDAAYDHLPGPEPADRHPADQQAGVQLGDGGDVLHHLQPREHPEHDDLRRHRVPGQHVEHGDGGAAVEQPLRRGERRRWATGRCGSSATRSACRRGGRWAPSAAAKSDQRVRGARPMRVADADRRAAPCSSAVPPGGKVEDFTPPADNARKALEAALEPLEGGEPPGTVPGDHRRPSRSSTPRWKAGQKTHGLRDPRRGPGRDRGRGRSRSGSTADQGPPHGGAVHGRRDRPALGLPGRGLQEALGGGNVTRPRLSLCCCVPACVGCSAASQRNEDFVPPEDAARAALEAYLSGLEARRQAPTVPDTSPAGHGRRRAAGEGPDAERVHGPRPGPGRRPAVLRRPADARQPARGGAGAVRRGRRSTRSGCGGTTTT